MWREQWRRVERWQARIETRALSTWVDDPGDEATDDLMAFFSAAWNLRDWLSNDPASGASASDVAAFASKSQPLRLAADLSNGEKHLTLTSSREGAGVTGRSFGVSRDDAGSVVFTGLTWTVTTSDPNENFDAVTLSRDIVTAWRDFFAVTALTP